ETDDDLGMGEFGIATRMAQSRHAAQAGDEPPEQLQPGATMIYRPRTQPTESVSLEEMGVERSQGVLTWIGCRHARDGRRAVPCPAPDARGRIEDPNVPRRHAEVLQEGSAYWVVGLGSTNGTEVGGRRVQRAPLENGSTFTVGGTTITFTTERG